MLLILLTVQVPATNAGTIDPVLIAVLDTGIDAWHPEFAPGQIVAWKDFVSGRPDPYDDNGHGTATASLVAGENVGSCGTVPKASFAPGARLAVAKVLDSQAAGTYEAVTSGIRWAIAQNADVISISIGGGLPLVGGPLPLDMTAAIEEARAAGILVVAAAGNGYLNAGVAPYPSWSAPFGNEPRALVVGGGTRESATLSTTSNTDPDVSSWSDNVCVARFITGGYMIGTGTSLAAPLVAGMAAKLIESGRVAGQPDDADRIEALLLYSARNSIDAPYAREGLGHLWVSQFKDARTYATTGASIGLVRDAYDAQGPHARVDREFRDVVLLLRETQDE